MLCICTGRKVLGHGLHMHNSSVVVLLFGPFIPLELSYLKLQVEIRSGQQFWFRIEGGNFVILINFPVISNLELYLYLIWASWNRVSGGGARTQPSVRSYNQQSARGVLNVSLPRRALSNPRLTTAVPCTVLTAGWRRSRARRAQKSQPPLYTTFCRKTLFFLARQAKRRTPPSISRSPELGSTSKVARSHLYSLSFFGLSAQLGSFPLNRQKRARVRGSVLVQVG